MTESNEAKNTEEEKKESPPGKPPAGPPKQGNLQDLLPILGRYAIEDIVGNKEAIGIIQQLLIEKTEEASSLKIEIEKLENSLREKIVPPASAAAIMPAAYPSYGSQCFKWSHAHKNR